MPNTLGKTRPIENPYAIFIGGGIEHRVLKTYKMPKSESKDPYARWFVAAKSDATFGGFDMGDTYARDVKAFGQLVAADPAWIEAYGIQLTKPTPAAWIESEENA